VKRTLVKTARIAIDLVALSIALWAAWLIRFDWDVPYDWLKVAMFTWPWVVGLQYFALTVLDVPRFSWRHVSLREVKRIAAATVLAAALLAAIRLLSAEVKGEWGYARYALVPMGVVLADLVFAFLATTGVRVLRRIQGEDRAAQRAPTPAARPVPTLLVGAGSAGVAVAKELAARPDLGIVPVGFLDDDPLKHGTLFHGVPVLGPTDALAEHAVAQGAEQALIAIATATGADIRRIRARCEEAGLPAKIIPAISEIVGGKVNLTAIRDVAIEDLLGRAPVELDADAIAAMVRRKTVLVTGAGGSIGAELCRQLQAYAPTTLVLVERAENNLFQIHRELSARQPAAAPGAGEPPTLVPALCDVRDAERLAALFRAHAPDVVLHAAAHKHVPMLEDNPAEAIRNNVLGTKQVADLAHAHACAAFVLVSTDKAVKPSSVMGATKRLAEVYVQALAEASPTRFVTVRFGNVLGSAGSVVPIFQDQIRAGGPVTVTHPDMTRYFMTIPEACQLILQAATMGEGGEIFVLDMGEPVKIVDLAHDLIRLSGLEPGKDVAVAFTGVRPGEKLAEELSTADEHADTTRHPKILVGRHAPRPLADVTAALADLARDPSRAALADLVPEATLERATPSRPRAAAIP